LNYWQKAARPCLATPRTNEEMTDKATHLLLIWLNQTNFLNNTACDFASQGYIDTQIVGSANRADRITTLSGVGFFIGQVADTAIDPYG